MEENRYLKGKIYKIVDNTNGNIYIGSTTEPTLARRLAKHRGNFSSHLNGTSGYLSSFEVIKNNDYDIVLIENFPCNSKDELHKQERFYIETLPCVNKCVPIRNDIADVKNKKKEYYNKNIEKILQQKKNIELTIKNFYPQKEKMLIKKLVKKSNLR
jgi:hypothetical protein